VRDGVCENFGNCTLADRHERQKIAPGEPLVCRECHLNLAERIEPDRPRRNLITILAGVLAVLVIAGIGAFLYQRSYPPRSTTTDRTTDTGSPKGPVPPIPTPPTPALPERKVLLHLAGSNTIGENSHQRSLRSIWSVAAPCVSR
jgi:phosphate transport system substrate-binding protein